MTRTRPGRKAAGPRPPSAAHLNRLIAEVTVDAYSDSEQAVGLYTMIEEHLAVPFTTQVLGVEVTVRKVDITPDDVIVAVCTRGPERQRLPLLELPLPDPPPAGSKWIHAYRRWSHGQ